VRSVLRSTAGSTIVLFNGSGIEATARLVSPQQAGAVYVVESVTYPAREPSIRLTVGLALLRGERFEVAVQKLAECGVARIVPLTAERCVISFDDARAWARRRERYRRVAREAAEQSERVTLLDIAEPVGLDAFLQSRAVHVLVERVDASSVTRLPLAAAMALAIGPEGGWSERELATISARAAGTASLGRLILRAETAAIVAAGTLIQRSWDDVRPGTGSREET
jgi:16S rRNA (uracil1498-N3)-methyltransferase